MAIRHAASNLSEIGIKSVQVVTDSFEAVQDCDNLIVGTGHGTNWLTG
jgi:hypothetical protein